MDEFETVYDDEGFSYKRKRIPDDADQRARTKIMAYNRLVKKRARDAHNSSTSVKNVGGAGRRADGRADARFDERATPSRSSGSVYMHELSPAEPLSPASRTRLATRRRRRIFDARKKENRETVKAEWRALEDMYSSNVRAVARHGFEART